MRLRSGGENRAGRFDGCSVAKGPKSVGELCDELKVAQPTASHHLGLLRMSKVVIRQRRGKQMFYSLDKERLKAVEKFLAGL